MTAEPVDDASSVHIVTAIRAGELKRGCEAFTSGTLNA